MGIFDMFKYKEYKDTIVAQEKVIRSLARSVANGWVEMDRLKTELASAEKT